MFTAMLTVENIVEGTSHDIWAVNVDEEYLEERPSMPGTQGVTVTSSSSGTGRDAPVVPRPARADSGRTGR
jgi:hypothetical protein